MAPIVVDRPSEFVLGHVEVSEDGITALPAEGLESVLDYESSGRRQTAAKALHLMVRGSHISGFVMRPDDGLSDVAIVSNGATRFLSPAEMQWLMHESAGRSILVDSNDEVEHLRERLAACQEKFDIEATEHELAMNKICGERDEARAEIQRLRYDAQKEAEQRDRMVVELEKLYAEREAAK